MEIINRQVNLNTLSALKENIKAALENGGIDTSKSVPSWSRTLTPSDCWKVPLIMA